jgi:hypothetical protein
MIHIMVCVDGEISNACMFIDNMYRLLMYVYNTSSTLMQHLQQHTYTKETYNKFVRGKIWMKMYKDENVTIHLDDNVT